jgi:hypothetical protein
VRYADDFVLMVAGTKEETEAARRRIKDKLSSIGLSLSEHKTQITHWSRSVQFLGYEIRGEMRSRGVGIRAVLTIPQEKAQKAKDAIEKVCSYHHIPEADLITQVSTMYRGWCNYYRYANSPQPVFGRLSKDAWWAYAHYLARKRRASIAATLRREKQAKRLVVVKQNGRQKQTFQTRVGDKILALNIIPPKTGSIQAIPNKPEWTVDLKPTNILNWQSGRSFTTRLTALDRANGVCERCKANPVKHVHHRVPIKGKTCLARVMSDQSQKETAIALCEECHLEVHRGSFGPGKQRLGRNAGCAERCLSGVGSAVEKPIAEM